MAQKVLIVSILLLLVFTGQFYGQAVKDFSNQEKSNISSDSIVSLSREAFFYIYKDIEKSEELANLAYDQALASADSFALAHTLNTLGSINWAEARYNLALKLYFESLSKYEALGDSLGILISLNNIGEVYKRLKNITNAKSYLFKAADIYKVIRPTSYPILNYLNLAEIYIEESKYDSASYYLAMVKNAPEDQLSENYLATINFDYALLNKDTSNYDLAKTFVDQSISFAKSIKNDRRLAESYNLLGEILLETNYRKEAEKNFELALGLAVKLHHELLELKINQNLYKLDLEEGKTINAITHILRYTELNDKIYTISVARQAAEFETVYELDRIEKENALLQLSQNANKSIIRYQVGFLTLALLALAVAIYFILAINKQRRSLKETLGLLEEKSQMIEKQKEELEKQAKNTEALNQELKLLNKNLESRAQEIAHEIEDKNKRMNKYAFMNAHKLRAPLASILGLINLFGKNISAEDEKKMVKMLKDSAHKLDNVVHEIRDVIDE